ncbi:MAG: septation protein A [Gammaproteobacteria bacterium]|jgi:intracellular septation protein|nr:septation protein A [Gammaproteobacteria bacterium]
MKLILDFFPIVIFFIVYKVTGDLITATAVLIPATVLQIAYTRWSTGKVEKMQLVTLIMVVFFGGMTVLLKDGVFIKWKPTVVNWLFAVVFLLSQFVGKKPVVQRIMESGITLPVQAWRSLNLAWVVFFAAMGLINLYVAFNFSEEIWVDFKLFGMLGLTLVFIVVQGLYMARHMTQPPGANQNEEE